MKVGQKVRPDTKCSRRLEDFLKSPGKAPTNLGAWPSKQGATLYKLLRAFKQVDLRLLCCKPLIYACAADTRLLKITNARCFQVVNQGKIMIEFWLLMVASALSLFGAFFHGMVGGRMCMNNINNLNLEPRASLLA